MTNITYGELDEVNAQHVHADYAYFLEHGKWPGDEPDWVRVILRESGARGVHDPVFGLYAAQFILKRIKSEDVEAHETASPEVEQGEATILVGEGFKINVQLCDGECVFINYDTERKNPDMDNPRYRCCLPDNLPHPWTESVFGHDGRQWLDEKTYLAWSNADERFTIHWCDDKHSVNVCKDEAHEVLLTERELEGVMTAYNTFRSWVLRTYH